MSVTQPPFALCGPTRTLVAEGVRASYPDVHAAHCVHCDSADRELLRTRGVYAALCVRSNRILQSGEPPIAAYLAELVVPCGAVTAGLVDDFQAHPERALAANGHAAEVVSSTDASIVAATWNRSARVRDRPE